MGLSHVFDGMFEQNPAPKKVGIIGGGPAGMMAAITAGKRGHQVKLYEAGPELGGQMIHADYLQKKWNLQKYKAWMIHAVETTPNVEVLCNTVATPELIAAEQFDALIVALGSKPKKGLVPGTENSYAPTDIFGKEKELGKKVVVIGGAMSGVDAALYLAESGHEVTILTRQRFAGYDYHSHGAFGFIMALAQMGTPAVINEAQVTKVEPGKVYYTDKDGAEHVIDCDDVVFSGGRDPMVEETMAFAGLSPIFRVVGDSNRQESAIYGMHEGSFKNVPVSYDIRHATYTGFMAAYSI
jgi:NADPH-dependent 2,4-dienoyl-CoA reductase/sulfur reductase-like enzyme